MAGFGFFMTIILGGLAGWIASRIMDSSTGILMNIILGVVGATIAGWLLGLAGLSAEPRLIPQMIVAILGAVILIWLGRKLRS